jgi:hypothetical protein
VPLVAPFASRVQAPARAGVGLRARLLYARTHRPPADWPDDWWQRDLDDQESWSYSPPPPTDRMQNLPPPPPPTP